MGQRGCVERWKRELSRIWAILGCAQISLVAPWLGCPLSQSMTYDVFTFDRTRLRSARAALAADLARLIMRLFLPAVSALFGLSASLASAATNLPQTFTPNDVHDHRQGAFALIGATVHPAPNQPSQVANVWLQDGKIVALNKLPVPAEYATIEVEGLHLYAGFVDLNSGYGLPAPAAPKPFNYSAAQVMDSTTPGAFNSNEAIRSQFQAVDHFAPDPDKAKQLRQLGFSVVLAHRADGVARGSGALIALLDGPAQQAVLRAQASAHFSLSKGSSAQDFPISSMGAVALLRQTFHDARWYQAQSPKPFVDRSLDALLGNQSLPQLMAVSGWLDLLRAQRVADEFDQRWIYLAGGDEYQRAQTVAALGADLVVPLDFPKPLEQGDPALLRMTDLSALQHWAHAPFNPARLRAAGTRIALTSAGLEADQYKPFWPNLRAAMAAGLSPDQALEALTTAPAAMIGAEHQLGRIAPGFAANLLLTSAPIEDPSMQIYENWVSGQRHVLATVEADLRGTWELSLDQQSYRIEVTGSRAKPSAKRLDPREGESNKLSWRQDRGRLGIELIVEGKPILLAGRVRGSEIAAVDGRNWRLTPISGAGQPDQPSTIFLPEPGPLTYPLGAYGRTERPAQSHLLFRNATVWTNESDGVLSATDVRIQDGKISEIGTRLATRGAREIDASGRHLTAGIIDEHSHIAVQAINDTPTNSAMVRIRDSLNPGDVDVFRNLAGGVTAAQILHGSANPIGGQSALIKLRWGALPDQMLIAGADGFIKFALGENVKKSSNSLSVRYPNTRMGVAQFLEDAFSEAEHYRDQWTEWRRLSAREQRSRPAPRVDLAMQALTEVLDQRRFISAHSYVQSEILMLMRLAERHQFRVNTFTHILEGYKVAERMAAHGVGGSSFADWWAYKMEVIDAIPYNNALMEQAGVVTAVNSDDAEMSRRLNQEAAKTIQYGDLSEEAAWKLVTLNPARLLHLDERMGSIRVGKDADLVLWSAPPLSIAARADYTLVDGRIEFDREQTEAMAGAISDERERLIQQMRLAKAAGAETEKPKPKPAQRFHCDDLNGYEYLGASHAH